jgi:hypothetical protein
MHLSYRGVRYESVSRAIAPVSPRLTGKYRGIDFSFHTTDHASATHSDRRLVYRGVGYKAQL